MTADNPPTHEQPGTLPASTAGPHPERQESGRLGDIVGWVLKHATALALVLGAVAYLRGYVAAVDFAREFGVPVSVFGLEFRDYVVLALVNLAVLVTIIAAAVLVLAGLLRAPVPPGTPSSLLARAGAPLHPLPESARRGQWLVVWSAVVSCAWALLMFGASWLESRYELTGTLLIGWTIAVLIGVVAGASAAAGYGWRLASRRRSVREQAAGWYGATTAWAFGAFMIVLAVWLLDLADSGVDDWATSLRSGEVSGPYALDLVLQPTVVAVYGDTGPAAIPDAAVVVRLNDRGAVAALLQRGPETDCKPVVHLRESAGLRFVVTDSSDFAPTCR